MPKASFLNHRRIRPVAFHSSKSVKPRRGKRLYAIKMIKLFAAILVPLMIGAFTVVTTVQDSNSVRFQRETDMERMERQNELGEAAEKRRRLADIEQLHEQHDYNDRVAREQRIQNVYDSYIRDLTSLVLKSNANLTLSELIFIRSRTSSVIDQIDTKRKWLLIKFLYDSQLLFTKDSGYKYVDLGGNDFANVRFGSSETFDRRLNLENIRLINVVLINVTFHNLQLKYSEFDYSDLTNSTFTQIAFFNMRFIRTQMENSFFRITQIQNCSFLKSELQNTTWTVIPLTSDVVGFHLDFSDVNLTGSKFERISLTTNVRFDGANLDRTEFIYLRFSSNLQFRSVTMRSVRFQFVNFQNAEIHHSDLTEAYFDRCQYTRLRFFDVDLRRSNFNNIPSSANIEFDRVNLLDSNWHGWNRTKVKIINSLLPNGTFVTNFRSLNINLLKNYNAEQGQCYNNTEGNFSSRENPLGWQRKGIVFQILYNHDNFKIDEFNTEWAKCLFRAGDSSGNGRAVMWQVINVSELAILIDSRQARFEASGYLGGFDDQRADTKLTVIFSSRENRNETFTVGEVSNSDRRNRTTLLFRRYIGSIPVGTVSVIVELAFERIKSFYVTQLGIADQLSFIIKQR